MGTWRWRLSMAAAMVAGVLCWGHAAVGATETTVPVATRPQSAAEAYQAIVVKLAGAEMEGRGPGTKGLDLARDYVMERLRAAGLRPAFGDSFLQPLKVPSGVRIEQQELATVPKAGRDAVQLVGGTDFQAMGFSAAWEFEGEAVFVGYSIADRSRKYDSYVQVGPDALRGKVAIVLRYEPQDANGVSLWTRRKDSWTASAALAAKVSQAARRGASAVLIVNPPKNDSGRVDPVGQTAGGPRAKVPVMQLTRDAWGRILRAAGDGADARAAAFRKAADEGVDRPEPLGVVLHGKVRLQPVYSTIHNVAGVLPGRGALADEFVVVGAHYDHIGYGEFGSRSRGRAIHPGADDNASGTAGVITLAQRLADRAAHDGQADRRSILFVAFTGEERGLLGSRHLVEHLSEAGIKIPQVATMLNMDMIGRLRQHRLDVWGVDSGDRLREIVAAASQGSPLKLRLSSSGFGPSDHTSFYAAKVPVLGFNTGGHGDLHMPSDTADKINPAGAIEVLDFVEAILTALATEEKRVAYVPPKRGGTSRPAAGGPYLGVMPDMDSRDEGCRLAVVMPDGPAAKAGLQDGDVIVGWDDRKVGSAADLMVLIRHTQGGAEVKLKVRRGGKIVELKVKLGGK